MISFQGAQPAPALSGSRERDQHVARSILLA